MTNKRNKIVTVIILVSSLIILIEMIYSLYVDINYFYYKKETKAVMSNYRNTNNSIIFNFYYRNLYLDSVINSSVELDDRVGKAVLHQFNNNGSIKAYYTKKYPNKIYIDDVNAPRFGILIFYLFIVAVMILSISISINTLKQGINN